MKTTDTTTTFRRAAIVLLAAAAVAPAISSAQTTAPGFHFESICRSDPGASKNKVTLVLHGPDYDGSQTVDPLVGVTINALWTFVDYRQNRAVFRYRLDSCTTGNDGSCTFSGGSQRARWQLSEVVGYEMSSPAFDTAATTTCPNSMMIDFW